MILNENIEGESDLNNLNSLIAKLENKEENFDDNLQKIASIFANHPGFLFIVNFILNF